MSNLKNTLTQFQKSEGTDQLVMFQTAVAAHKGGFNLPVTSYFKIGALSKKFIEEVCAVPENINAIDTGSVFSRPTQSLLQKWLREVHRIDVSAQVNFYNKSKKLGYFYSLDCFDSNDIHDGKDYDFDQIESVGKEEGFDSYEEALEVGLLLALDILNSR